MPYHPRFIVIVMLLLINNYIFAQTSEYQVTANNKEIGKLTVSETNKNGGSQIEIISDVSIRLLFLIELNYKLTSIYRNGKLYRSDVTTYLNGKVHSSTVVEKRETDYLITKDGRQTFFTKPINYTGGMIYLSEPINVSTVFSEIDAAENKAKQIAPNKYKLFNPKNKEIAEYHYENGKLMKAIVRQPFVDFIMTLK